MVRRALALLTIFLVTSPATRALACESDDDCAGSDTCTDGECRSPANKERVGVARTGAFIVSAERLFGYASTTSSLESKSTGEESTSTTRTFGLLLTTASNALTLPRLAVDFNVYSGLTLGGAIGYATRSRGDESDAPESNAFLFAPRVGWLTTSGKAGFWARAGVTYFSTSDKSGGSTGTEINSSGLSAQIEPALLVTPLAHVMFSLAAHLNIPLNGSLRVNQAGTTTSYKAELWSAGATVGLHAWF